MRTVLSQCRVRSAAQHVREPSLARFAQYLHSDGSLLNINASLTFDSQAHQTLMQLIPKNTTAPFNTTIPSNMIEQSADQSGNDFVTDGYWNSQPHVMPPRQEEQAQFSSSSLEANLSPHVADNRDAEVDQGNMYQGFLPAPQHDYDDASVPYFKHLQPAYDFIEEESQNLNVAYSIIPEWLTQARDAASHGTGESMSEQGSSQSRSSNYDFLASTDIDPDLSSDVPMLTQQEQVPPPTQPSDGLLFTSFAEAQATIVVRGWRSPSSDITIPTTDFQRQEVVLRLLAAINNIEDVYDAQGGQSFRKRWLAPLDGASVYYRDTDKEQVAWDILSLAESLHLNGPSVFMSFDTVFWRQTTSTRNWTFAERIDKIEKLLAISKARCEKLLAGLSLQTVVGHPAYLIRMTKGNGMQNGKRQLLLEAGRAAKEADI
jgi:hypothetical protein